jgi:hypothetical protein
MTMYATFLFLLSFLLPLPYDASRRVGDVTMIYLYDGMRMALNQGILQKHKVDEMRRIARATPNDLKEFAEEEALLEDFTATIDALHSAGDYLRSLGYRRQPPDPVPAGTPLPERK